MIEESKKIKCQKCGSTIAKGETPAPVEIKCKNCGQINDLKTR